MSIFLLMILIHMLGDFYFQTNHICKRKCKSLLWQFIHASIYGLPFLLFFLYFTYSPFALYVTGCMIATHFLFDLAKCRIQDKLSGKTAHLALFFTDQALHIGIVWLISIIAQKALYPSRMAFFQNGYFGKEIIEVFSLFYAALLCGKPAAHIVNLLLMCLRQPDDETPSNGSGLNIGVLEREIILVLIMLQQYAAIGFVMTAKSFARYKNLENKFFAEKYLVGTLASVLISLVCGMFLLGKSNIP